MGSSSRSSSLAVAIVAMVGCSSGQGQNPDVGAAGYGGGAGGASGATGGTAAMGGGGATGGTTAMGGRGGTGGTTWGARAAPAGRLREISPAGELVQTIQAISQFGNKRQFGYADYRETLYGPPLR